MKLGKFLSIVITNFIIITSYTKAQIIMDFLPNGEFNVNCDGNKSNYKNITDLSNGINYMTGKYLTCSDVRYRHRVFRSDDIVFSNIQNNGDNYCALLLRGCKNYEPLIVLKCGNSKVVFDKITIEHIKIKIITTTAECQIKHGNR